MLRIHPSIRPLYTARLRRKFIQLTNSNRMTPLWNRFFSPQASLHQPWAQVAYALQNLPLVRTTIHDKVVMALFISLISNLISGRSYAADDKKPFDCKWLLKSLALVQPQVLEATKQMKAVADGTIKNGAQWVKDRITNPTAITPAEYETLRNRKVSEYFTPGEIKTEDVDKFYADYEKVAKNFGRMHLGDAMFFKKGLPKEKEREEHWKAVRDDVMRYGFVAVEKDKTLEQLLMDQHFEQSRPEEKPPLRERLKQFAWEAPWIPLVVAKKSTLFILGESKWAFRSAVLGSTLAVMLGMFTNPINDNIAIFMNDHFGHIATWMQLWFADLGTARAKLDQLVKIKDEMKEVDRRYQMDEINEQDAKKLWRKLEETFLRYAQELNSVVPDNVARGRVYFRDGNILTPLSFVTAASTVQSEILAHESAIRDFERIERADGGLSDADRETLSTAKQRLDIAKKRMGGVLASIKIYEMIYPELTRNKFQKEKSTNEFFQGYKVLMGSMHLEDYSEAYLNEMDAVLKQFSISLNHPEKK